jgi:putative spermidine/putrescine transport system permease protein
MNRGGIPFVAPMLALSVAGFLVPLLVLGAFSFRSPGGGYGFENYAKLLADPLALAVLGDTLLLGAKVVGLTTLIGLPIAVLFWHAGPRERSLIVFLTLLPMLVSNVVRTFAWIVMLGRQGPVSQTLAGLGFIPAPRSFLFNETAVVIALTQIELPLLLLPVMAVLSRMDRSYVSAAETLGAGPWRILATVVLPLAAPGFLAGWVLVFASATTSYVTHAAIGGARHIYLPQYIYREVGVLFQWPSAAAVAFVLLAATGAIMAAIAALSRHRRMAIHA